MNNNEIYYRLLHGEKDSSGNLIKKSDLPDFALSYFKTLDREEKSLLTRIQYAYDISAFFVWLQDQTAYKNRDIYHMSAAECLGPLTIDDINEYTDSFRYIKNDVSRTTSSSYNARRISSLRSFLSYYASRGDITTNLVSMIHSPSIKKKDVITLNKADIDRLMAAVNESKVEHGIDTRKRDYAILVLLLGTGIRVSELVNIDLQQVDWIDESIVVTRKGGDEDRIYINEFVKAALEDYLDECRPALLTPASEEKALFVSYQGTRITPRSVQRMIKKYQSISGLTSLHITPHTMRRSYGTTLYEQTNDIGLVADALNHKSVDTAKRFYVKVSEEHKKQASKAISVLFDDKEC